MKSVIKDCTIPLGKDDAAIVFTATGPHLYFPNHGNDATTATDQMVMVTVLATLFGKDGRNRDLWDELYARFEAQRQGVTR